MTKHSLFIYTETSLHAGTGSTVSVVDLPIQRERTTNYPIIQGSGVKGALRSQANLGKDDEQLLFGIDPDIMQKSKEAFAGAISVGDARIVLFPVRSLMGVFAYVTCPHVLARVGRETGANLPSVSITDDSTALVTSNSSVVTSGSIVLEEFTFAGKASKEVDTIAKWLADNALPQGEEYAYWRTKLASSLVVLPDNAFKDFVTTSTEIVTRVKLVTETKTVDTKIGGLWTQESLPSDTLLMSGINISSRNPNVNGNSLKEVFDNKRIQIGGDETTGDGFVALKWL
jgi:CRISPR-associated protein Cmr4